MHFRPYTREKRGIQILRDPALNKGTAFTEAERDALGLRGLLPPRVNPPETQLARTLDNLRGKASDIEKYIFLVSLLDRNETLFYRLVCAHIEETLPLIYTPTVGKACQAYGNIFRRPRGLYISANDRGRVRQILRNWPHDDVRIAVVTDGERILGLGDLGANGMGIPVGKLSLYTACAGVPPWQCLPITLDVGTNNKALREDPLYIGTPCERLRGAAYDELVDEFISGMGEIYPGACIQFEDFGNANAFRLLHRYQDRVCTFNDDIQGTASVALAGLYSALRITGKTLAAQRILFLGAGEAGIGIGNLIVDALRAEGVPEPEARRHCWFVDSKGLVTRSRPGLSEHKQPFAHEHPGASTLLDAVNALSPTALIGVSGQAGGFTQQVVEAMARRNEHPIIFALSNPTSQAECTAEQACVWSDGRAVIATGSPFAPVEHKGKTHIPGQGNNAYIFPGLGLGVIAARARRVTNEMFFIAARTLASCVSDDDLAHGRVFPRLANIRAVSQRIAIAVATTALERGLSPLDKNCDVTALVNAHIFQPEYHDHT
ncbi:MAG: NAD-dependent malic enzyme [Puniceicoccales bacterium]|jgi:malate dehydrogenase (oxaloacetate-decarboxylating)(NADP+)|nr:NAD-dependent malic enzyme [Puniceicoccales bacterium]